MRVGGSSRALSLGVLAAVVVTVSASASASATKAASPTRNVVLTARLSLASGGRHVEGVINFRLHRDQLYLGSDPMGDSELFGVPLFTKGVEIDADGVSYVKVRPSSAGPSWFRKDHSGEALAVVDERPYQDPSTLLQFLESASSDLHLESIDEVRGVQTTHYAGTIAMSRVLELVPAAKRAQAAEDIDFRLGESKTGVSTAALSVGAWIDGAGVARRLRMIEAGYATTWEYYDFGVEASIPLPAEKDVMSAADMDAYLGASK
jgi:hypothetical protein